MKNRINKFKQLHLSRKFGIILSLVLLCIVFTILSPRFLSSRNIVNILQQTTINGVVAIGMTLVIITSGIDLSVGSVVALSSMIMAKMMVNGVNLLTTILVGLIVGIICGVINGLLIAIVKLQPFLVTLGTMSVYRGLTLIISNGLPVRGLPQNFSHLMNSLNATFPVPIIILLILSIIIFFLVRYTRYGQYIFAIGGNEEATRLSGINVALVKISSYTIVGVLSVFAAIIFLGRLAAADPQAGSGYEMNAIAAAAIGGASLAGGKGSIIGTIIGALILATLSNGLILLNVQSFYQTLAVGLIIIVATVLDKYSNK